jgi:hypothetical protein
MADIFDELDAPPKRDVFDELEPATKSDIFSEPEIIDVRPIGRQRVREQMAAEKSRLQDEASQIDPFLNTSLMTPVETVGNVVRGAAADLGAAASIFKRPEGREVPLLPSPSLIGEAVEENLPFAASQSGNLPAALNLDPLPVDQMLADVSSESPAAATLGKIQQGLAGSAPLLAIMPQGAIGKLVAAGFTADMLRHAGPDATALGEEMGKPPEERDYDKLTSALSGLIQTTAFAPATGVHAFGAPARAAVDRINPSGAAIRELAKQLQSEPRASRLSPDEAAAVRLGLPPRSTPEMLPELRRTQELNDRAVREANQRIIDPTQTPAIDLLRAQGNEIIPGSAAPEFRPGGGPAAGGKVSFSRPAEEMAAASTASEPSLSVAAPEVSPSASRFVEEFRKPDSKIANMSDAPDMVTTVKTGMELKSIADLEALLAANNQSRSVLRNLREKQRSGEKLTPEEMQQFYSNAGKVQFPREAVEVATNSGAWSEANQAKGPRPQLLGERPLDWQKNPEVEAWLRENGKEFGIEMPEASLKSEPRQLGRDRIEIGEPPPMSEVQRGIADLQAEFPSGLKVKIVESYHELPDSVHQSAYRQGANPVGVKGVVTGDTVYINRQMLDSIPDLRQLFLHEQAGHFATDKILGPKLEKFMKQVHDSFANDALMAETRRLYQKATDIRLGREFVARLSENPKASPTVWNRIVAQFREWLRDIGWVKKVSENDIRVLLQRSMDSLKAKEGGMSPEEISLSLRSAAQAAQQRYPATGAPPTPPAPPTATPPAAPAGGTPRARVTLDDVYRIFEPTPKASPTLRQRSAQAVEAFRTGVSSKFRPVNKLAEDIARAYGRTSTKDIAGIMEQLKGSQGKAEADIYRFDQDVSKAVKGSEKDFNAYMFLQRTVDRLNQDAADVAAGRPARRSVGQYTLNDIGPKIRLLEQKLGPDKLRQFETAAREYQRHMDQALQLQVESGRMSPQVYADIKAGNQFYAPFKVMKYIEEQMRPPGSGRRVDTMADYTKAMEGIEDPNIKLGDMLAAARQGISMSRILADKNTAMRHVAELAAFDPQGLFIKKLGANANPSRGMEAVNVLENGKETRYSVAPEVAEAIQLYGGNAGGVISRALSAFSIPFRAGATALNIPFQGGNLLIADAPRAALLSKYGIQNPGNFIQYPFRFAESLLSSLKANVLGVKDKLYLDFLDSGVAGATVQEHLTPGALKFQEPTSISRSKKLGQSVLYTIPRFAKAIEEANKVLGVKQAMKIEGVSSGKELAKQVPEAITELRRFSGSPDFGRQGKWVEQARLNLLYMFLNARIQGTVADVGRLGGRDGAATAAKSWMKLATAVGIPTAYLYYLNHHSDYAADYAKRPQQEKQNYWMIPKDTFIVNDDGEKMRDYWRIPKRESSKWIANLTESALDFADKRDPQSAKDFGASMLQEISPVNISGENARERMESVAASLNPLIKAPLELASGRDLYRHRDIIPESMQKASPEEQFTPRTSEAFKKVANSMPDVAPEFLRSPLLLDNLTRNLTAGLFTQFIPRKPVEGRSGVENTPLLSRFQALPYTDNTATKEQLRQLEREAADEQLSRHRTAVKLLDENKGKQLFELVTPGMDEKLVNHLVDLWVAKENGVTAQERQILALPVRQRAIYVSTQLSGLDANAKQQKILDLARKRILTEGVLQAMGDEL